MQYTNASVLAAYLKRELTGNEIDTLNLLVPAVQLWIDRKLDTTFVEADEATTRTFDGGERSIDIDPCTEITKVEALDYTGASSYEYTATQEYQAYPLNETVKTELVRRHSCWPGGDARIAVTAKFSSYDDGVPEDIQMVATKIAADLLNMGSANAEAVKSESLEGHKVEYQDPYSSIDKIASNDPYVRSVLDLRRDISLG